MVGVQSLLSQVLPLAFVSALSAAYVARAVPAAGLAILGLQAHAINDDWRLRCQGEAGAVATVGWLFVQGLLGSLALLGRGGLIHCLRGNFRGLPDSSVGRSNSSRFGCIFAGHARFAHPASFLAFEQTVVQNRQRA